MLHGTPLGKHALQRLMPDPPKPPAEPPAEPPAAGEAATAPRKPKKEPVQGAALSPDEVAGLDDGLPAGEPEVSPEEARAAGVAAAREGKPVSSNPYPFGATRAAFDEGWCSEVGGDGMDIPSAWRRTPKKKPDETKGEAS